MSGPTFQPPIHLDPNQDPAQQTAFINQNFLSLANALESNSFRIVSSGETSLASANFITASNSYGSGTGFAFPVTQTIPHKLNYIPFPLAVVDNGNNYIPLPYTFNGGNGTNYYVQFTVKAQTDINNLYIAIDAFGYNSPAFGGGGIPSPSLSIKYFLLQQSAN